MAGLLDLLQGGGGGQGGPPAHAQQGVPTAPTPPPHLRPAEGPKACGACQHFKPGMAGRGHCDRFNWPVSAGQLSDGFQPRQEAPPSAPPAPGNQPGQLAA